MHLQKDVFFETFLRRLEYISKKTSFTWRLEDVSNTTHKRCLSCDIFKMSQIDIKVSFRGRSKRCYHVRSERSTQKLWLMVAWGMVGECSNGDATTVYLLKRYCTPATKSYFMKFNFLSETSPKNITLKKTQVKIKSRSKVMPVSVFYLWRYLWQTFRISTNFMYNSSLGRSTKFLISDQDFNQSLWKLVQRESIRFETLKSQNFCKMLGEKCVLGTPS